MSTMLSPKMETMLRDSDLQFLATLYSIGRTDGQNFYFTDHDGSLEYEGNTYTPAGGLNPSARQRQVGLKPNNMEAAGFLTSEAITHEDLRAGLWRDARVDEIVVDWRYPWAGYFSYSKYWITETTFTGELWEATLTDQSAFLRRAVGQTYTRTCRWQFGDTNCGQVVSGITGTVDTVVDDRRRFLATGNVLGDTLPGGAYPDQYFQYGVLTWTSGNNNGLLCEVKKFSEVGSKTIFDLELKQPYAIQVGDTFSVKTGCDKQVATCVDKFNNLIRFGGFPFIPGNRKMARIPKSKST